jgi:hypothetical protein
MLIFRRFQRVFGSVLAKASGAKAEIAGWSCLAAA